MGHRLRVIDTDGSILDLMLNERPQATGTVTGCSTPNIVRRLNQQGQAIDRLRQLKHDILKRLILAAPMFLQILSQLLKLIQKFFSRPC